MPNSVKMPDGRWVPRGLIDAYKDVRALARESGPAPIFDDLNPAWREEHRCPNCGGVKGQGMLYAPTGPETRPVWMGGERVRRELVGYSCPVCTDESFRAMLRARCGVNNPQHLRTLEIWEVQGRRTMVKCYQEAISRYSNGQIAGWLTFLGPYGCGKTFFGQRLVADMVATNIEAVYVMAHDLSRGLLDAIGTELTPSDVLGRYIHVPVLVIDQLDWLRQRTARGDMSYVAEQLLHLLDDRYRVRQYRATVLILNSEWWDRGGEEFAAVLSRAQEGIVARTGVADLREVAGDSERSQKWSTA